MDKMAEEVQKARFEEVVAAPQGKGEALAAELFKDLVDTGDFDSAFKAVYQFQDLLGSRLQSVAVRDALRTTTKDRTILSFIDAVGFDNRNWPLKEPVCRLNRLLSFTPGRRVLSRAWGLGMVKGVDSFYRRVTVDFTARRGHQFSYDAACETLVLAPENHILVKQATNPDAVAQMLKEKPGDFLKEMLTSFGDMPVTRLEELCAQYGFVKQANWKKFWEGARVELRKDKTVEIPTRRAEPIHVKAQAESYGDEWYTALEQMKDPKSILSSVREVQGAKLGKDLSEDAVRARKAIVADRLAFALKGAKGVDDALYARIAFAIDDLKLDEFLQDDKRVHATTAKTRAYLWAEGDGDEERYLVAARTLPARETGRLVEFLASSSSPDEAQAQAEVAEAKRRLFAALPRMCFAFLTETLFHFISDPDCEAAVAALLKQSSAPATLVTLVLGRWKSFEKWTSLPPLVVVITHAIALGEGKQGGETLRMQNTVRRLFADQKWLEDIFKLLQPADQALFFERFQASIAWDPSTHHMIVMRMTKIVPALASRLAKKESVKKIERITSLRSYAERQAAYEKLINVDIPNNTARIEFARSYGDLSENAEYQYAKDEQRALLQKQTLMQEDLNVVKAVDFADVEPSEVRPGTTVRIVTAAGETRVYTVLGEWDNDLERGIISNKTQLAQNMLGKKSGDTFDLPDEEGNVSTATISAVESLADEIRAWIKAAPAAV